MVKLRDYSGRLAVTPNRPPTEEQRARLDRLAIEAGVTPRKEMPGA